MELNESVKKRLDNAIVKKATGYLAKETVDDFAVDECGNMSLTKRKITTKAVPPDISAIKLLLEQTGEEELTESELIVERDRLIKLLKDGES